MSKLNEDGKKAIKMAEIASDVLVALHNMCPEEGLQDGTFDMLNVNNEDIYKISVKKLTKKEFKEYVATRDMTDAETGMDAKDLEI